MPGSRYQAAGVVRDTGAIILFTFDNDTVLRLMPNIRRTYTADPPQTDRRVVTIYPPASGYVVRRVAGVYTSTIDSTDGIAREFKLYAARDGARCEVTVWPAAEPAAAGTTVRGTSCTLDGPVPRP